MTNNIFILRVEECEATETQLLVEEAYQSRTNAIKEMEKLWEKEKQKWLEDCDWRKGEDFTFKLTSNGGWIGYGWGRKSVMFTLTRLKIEDFKKGGLNHGRN